MSKYTNKQAERIADALLQNSFLSIRDYDVVYELVRGFINYDKTFNPSTNKEYPSHNKPRRRYTNTNKGKKYAK
jgi:hypothetical protein